MPASLFVVLSMMAACGPPALGTTECVSELEADGRFSHVQSFSSSSPSFASGSQDIQSEKQWRYTKNGWQQIQLRHRTPAHIIRVPAYEPAAIHPFQITLLLLLGATALIAWASDEWDWSRLMKRQ